MSVLYQKTRDKCAPTPPTMLLHPLADWQNGWGSAMAMERDRFRDALCRRKDEQIAKVVQMLEAKVAAAKAKHAAELRSTQLDAYSLSSHLHAWAQKCRKLEDKQIDSHVEQHNESVKLHQILKQADSVQRELREKHLALRRETARQELVLRLELECTRGRMSRLEQDLAARDATLVAEAGMNPGTALETFYLTQRYISQGTDGVVFEATRCRNGVHRARAVKAVKVAQMGLARIVGEIKIGLEVDSHHVVPVYEVFREDSGPLGLVVLITMELMRVSLWDVLEKWGTLQEPVAALVMSHILSGVQCLHSAQILHGDLKPGNLMVAMDGFIKISDHAQPSRPASWEGRYMAREVLTGKGYGIMADMWSVGVTLHDLLAGRGSMSSECETVGRLILHRTPISLSPVFSVNAQDFVSRCLSIDQDSRLSAVEAPRFIVREISGNSIRKGVHTVDCLAANGTDAESSG
ncbi:hypothetical protein HDU77_009959 [Chytriomyces hyalinus]|nr:hypothetical protein HDU77_009959 [Chytriomyces hyalinus]